MKKIFSIFLLLALLMQVAGYHLVFRLQRQEIREQMEAQIHKQTDRTCEILVIGQQPGEEQPDWENSREFRYKGHMYDLLKKEIRDGKQYLSVMKDKNETELLDAYLRLAKNDFGKSNTKKSAQLIKLISNLYMPVSVPEINHPAYPASSWPVTQIALPDGLRRAIPKPPPQLV